MTLYDAVANGTEMPTEGMRCWLWSVSTTQPTVSQSNSIQFWPSLHLWRTWQWKPLNKSKTSSFKVKHFWNETVRGARAWLVKQELQCCRRKCSVVFPIFVFFNCPKVLATEWTHVLGSVLSELWGESCRSVPLAAGLATGYTSFFNQPTYLKMC